MIDSSFISCHRNSKLSTRLVFLNKRKKKKKYRHALSNLVFKLFETPATLTHNVAQRWNIVNNCNNESAWKKRKKKNITCVNVHETHLFVKLIPDFRTKWNVSFSCNKCVNNNNQNRASFFLVSIITFLFFFLLLLLSRVFPIRLTDASCFFFDEKIL